MWDLKHVGRDNKDGDFGEIVEVWDSWSQLVWAAEVGDSRLVLEMCKKSVSQLIGAPPNG